MPRRQQAVHLRRSIGAAQQASANDIGAIWPIWRFGEVPHHPRKDETSGADTPMHS